MTRADHDDLFNQTYAAYAHGKQAQELSVILGEAALSDLDKLYLKFASEFEERYVGQGYRADRSIDETLDLSWELLLKLPRRELKKIDEKFLEERLGKAGKNTP